MNTFTSLFAVIVDAALKATALLALAWIAGRALKNRSSASRHMVRIFALSAALLLPLLSSFVPAWHVRGIPQFAGNPPEQTSAQSMQAATAGRNPEMVLPPAKAAIRVKTIQGKKASTSPASPLQQPISAAVPDANATDATNAASAAASRGFALSWPQLLGIIWLLGAIALIFRMVIGRLRLLRLVRSASPVEDHIWAAQLQFIRRALGIHRPVELLQSQETEVPLATGAWRPKVILPVDHAEWTPVRRSAVLQHELAHIQRLDTFTQPVADLAVALYWFHPLVWATAAAVRAERERACDDCVLALGAKPSEYAHELLEIASSLRQPALGAALAMARRSQLEGRLLALLNPALRRGSVSRKVALAIGALTLCVVFPLAAIRAAQESKPSPATRAEVSTPGAPQHAPVANDEHAVEPPEPAEPAQAAEPPEPSEPAVPPDSPELSARNQTGEAPAPPSIPAAPSVPSVPAVPAVPGVPAVPAVPAVPPPPGGELDICGAKTKMHHMSINSDNGHKSWNGYWSGDNCSVELRAEGAIEFNAEATDLQSISSGGFFELNQRQGDTWKQLRVTSSGNGLQYVYKVNGTQQVFDNQPKAWFSSFLLELERSSGFNAESRVRKLLEKGGPAAVLEEINHLQGDYVRGIYFRKLLEQPNLPPAVVVRVINQAGEQVGSDYERARILMEVARQYPLEDEASRTAFLNAAGKLSNDYEHSRVLIELLKRPNISSRQVDLALHSAASLSSDYEKSRVLLSLLEQKSFDQAYLDFYLKLAASIQSDYEKSRDLLAPMQKYTLDQKQINQIMDATSTIGSDYEKSRLLIGLLDKGKFDEKQMAEYLKVAGTIGSDYERSRSLISLMEQDTLSKEALSTVLDATRHIGSDYEKSRVLLALAGKYPIEGALRDKYISIANSLSAYERERALAGIAKRASI